MSMDALARLLVALVWLGSAAWAAQAEGLHRYWPRFPRPRAVIQVPFVGDAEEGMTFETAAGLAADALLRGRGDVLLLEDVSGNSGYRRWTAAMLALVRPRRAGSMDTWEAVAALQRRRTVRGYILFRYDTNDRPWHGEGAIDESANVATSLAALTGGVAVSERFQSRTAALGLPMILDARGRTEQWCLETYGQQFSHRVVATADPKSRVVRSLAVATRAFVVSRPGPTYEAALARCEPDCPVLGWGCGGEDQQTMPSSEYGLFQTATNWCHNLPAYSTEAIGETIPAASVRSPRAGVSLADVSWETGVHYAAFLMSDGDNVQWLMGNFAGGSEGREYYESPSRGRFPMGWTFPYADLAQLCPYVLQDLFRRARATDDFVLYGGGYFYPDCFGRRRKGDALGLHARRMAAYMRVGGLRTIALNAQDWDGPDAQRAYRTVAGNVPGLDGIFTVQYYPYSGGEGRILWASAGGREVPVVSCALCIWAQTGRPRDTTPAGVARWLNGAPRGGPNWSDADFSFVMPHAWSRFRDTGGDPSPTAEEQGVDQNQDAPGTARGLLPVYWAVRRLGAQVRVVTPGQLALLVRLHLRTRQALGGMAADVGAQAAAARSAQAKQLVARARAMMPKVRDGDDSGRECFGTLQRAARVIARRG
jgi:hypothetical protein